jgi:hypothetical protein
LIQRQWLRHDHERPLFPVEQAPHQPIDSLLIVSGIVLIRELPRYTREEVAVAKLEKVGTESVTGLSRETSPGEMGAKHSIKGVFPVAHASDMNR